MTNRINPKVFYVCQKKKKTIFVFRWEENGNFSLKRIRCAFFSLGILFPSFLALNWKLLHFFLLVETKEKVFGWKSVKDRKVSPNGSIRHRKSLVIITRISMAHLIWLKIFLWPECQSQYYKMQSDKWPVIPNGVKLNICSAHQQLQNNIGNGTDFRGTDPKNIQPF